MEISKTLRKRKFMKQVRCEICFKEFERARTALAKSKRVFCSKKCYGKGISSGLVKMNIQMTKEVREKIAMANKGNKRASGHIHSKETRNKISENAKERLVNPVNNPMYGKSHTEEAKQQMSEKHAELILNGKKTYGKNHKFGHHESCKNNIVMFYRSSWELACMKWLDSNSAILTYDYEPFKIEYCKTGRKQKHKRYYIPDFLVEFTDGRKELWEIKPKQFVDNERTVLKKEAAIKYCKQASISSYKILTRENLIELKILT